MREQRGLEFDLAWDTKRLAWWGEFLAGRGVHYVQALSPDDIDAGKAVLYERGLRDGGVRQHLAALRQLLRLGVRRWRWLRENPMAVVELPKRAQAGEDKRLPTEDEQDRLLEAARQWPPPMPIPPRAERRPKRGAQCGPGGHVGDDLDGHVHRHAEKRRSPAAGRAPVGAAGRDPVLE